MYLIDIYVILSVLYSHTLSISTPKISINTLRIFSAQTHYIIQRGSTTVFAWGVVQQPPPLSGQQPEFSVARGRHRPTVFFLWGGLATLHPPSGDTYSS